MPCPSLGPLRRSFAHLPLLPSSRRRDHPREEDGVVLSGLDEARGLDALERCWPVLRAVGKREEKACRAGRYEITRSFGVEPDDGETGGQGFEDDLTWEETSARNEESQM